MNIWFIIIIYICVLIYIFQRIHCIFSIYSYDTLHLILLAKFLSHTIEMSLKAVAVLLGESVKGVVHFEQEVTMHIHVLNEN